MHSPLTAELVPRDPLKRGGCDLCEKVFAASLGPPRMVVVIGNSEVATWMFISRPKNKRCRKNSLGTWSLDRRNS